MSAAQDGLIDHLGTGVTTVCRVWSVKRTDGVTFGFTDHDLDLGFDGLVFKASTGMTARGFQQTTGLSVDNSEAVGGFSDDAITEADLRAGRFDAAEVRSWLVNWRDVEQRIEQFSGNFGEISYSGGKFKAELRGLSDRLNQLQGRVYQSTCSAVLGDTKCRFDLTLPGFRADAEIRSFGALGQMQFSGLPPLVDRWFERGKLVVLTGLAKNLVGVIRTDRVTPAGRDIDLWLDLGAKVAVGDLIRLEAGCDRQALTCRGKFSNFLNFRGFPSIPGDDWLSSYPVSYRPNDGGSLG